MATTKSTKRALLLSGLALLMCVSMLIGSTFAWFTDSVTSAGNKIIAGNLDVQLLMNTGNGYEDISNSTAPIFGAGSIAQDNNAQTLWEPGKTQVAYLAIKNNGTLALKYTVALDVQNVSKDLYKVIKYTITPDAMYEEVTAWDKDAALSVVPGAQVVSDTDIIMNPGDTHYFALSLHMDEEAGNEYKEGEVNFDLTVLATQAAVESDDFNDQYDNTAENPVVGVATIAENAPDTAIPAGNVSVTVPEGSDAGVYTVSVTNQNEVVNENGQTTFSTDISLLKDGVKVSSNGSAYLVKIDIGTGKQVLKVLHNGEEVADFDYNEDTGILEFETSSFSPFAVIYEKYNVVKVDSTEAFKEAVANITEETVINAGGMVKNMSEVGTASGSYTVLDVQAGTTIKNLTLNFDRSNSVVTTHNGTLGGGEIVFENCTFLAGDFTGTAYFQSGADSDATKLVFVNCTFASAKTIFADNSGAGVEVNNTKFNLNADGYGLVQCMGGNHTFNSCEFNISSSKSMGSSPITKYGQLNLYSERFSTNVTTNQCVNLPSVFRYAASTGTNTFTNNP